MAGVLRNCKTVTIRGKGRRIRGDNTSVAYLSSQSLRLPGKLLTRLTYVFIIFATFPERCYKSMMVHWRGFGIAAKRTVRNA